MPSLVRGDGIDLVLAPHGTGTFCATPTIYHTDTCSEDVFVGGYGVVREGDIMETHPMPGCAPHTPACFTYSSTVYVNGKRVARVGDVYMEGGGDQPHVIITGVGTVFSG
jgi:uncharacterized Zn-binding protein involved in type VI secretion